MNALRNAELPAQGVVPVPGPLCAPQPRGWTEQACGFPGEHGEEGQSTLTAPGLWLEDHMIGSGLASSET